MIPTDGKLKEKSAVVLPSLNEKQRRLLLGAEALALGYGGIKYLSDITGVSENTIAKGVRDVEEEGSDVSRVRRPGSGRKKLTAMHPDLRATLVDIIEPDTSGDPENPLRWTCKSVRNIADFLTDEGYTVSRQSVARILHSMEGRSKSR